MRQFLGKINYYHKFIDNCAIRLEPLHNLLRKNVPFVWSPDCQDCFEDLKKRLCSEPILQIFNYEKEIFIETDASRIGIGAILKQKGDDDMLHPVAYFSKKLKPTQSRKDAIYIECYAIKEAISYWQHYLMGQEFTVLTDHKPLENLRVKARPDTLLGHLVNYLSQFNFKIVYRKGRENTEADALSRNPVLEHFESEELICVSNLLTLQEIQDDQNENIEHFQLEPDQQVMFKVKNNHRRIIISESLGRNLIEKVHLSFGHIGSKKIVETIIPQYYFPNMRHHAQEFCDACVICLCNKTRTKRPLGFIDRLVSPSRPFQLMSLDTVGGLSGNKSTKRYLHILTDHFSKFAWIHTSTTQKAKDFIKLIRKVTDTNQIELLLFDRYSGINSKDLKKYLKENKVSSVFTPRNHPSSNGSVERLGQTLINRIRCKYAQYGRLKPWSRIAEECVEEYNRTIHSVTRFPPCYLQDGTEVTLSPIDLNENDLNEDRKQAKVNNDRFFNKMKQRVDKKFKDKELKIGDLVFVDLGNKLSRNKLDPIRDGPFQIIEQCSPLMYRLDIKSHRDRSCLFHKDQLHPFFSEKRFEEGEM